MKITAIIVGILMVTSFMSLPVFAQWGPGNGHMGYGDGSRGFYGPGDDGYTPQKQPPYDSQPAPLPEDQGPNFRNGPGFFNGGGHMMGWGDGGGFWGGGHMMGNGGGFGGGRGMMGR